MKNKFFFTKESCSFTLNSLIPNEIKVSYSKEINSKDIKRNRYLNLLAKTLGFNDWTQYLNSYQDEIVPFLINNGLIKYGPEYNIDILEAKSYLSFNYRQVADRLFFDKRLCPKKIFTGYNCTVDNFGYYNLPTKEFDFRPQNSLNQFDVQESLILSDNYNKIKEDKKIDFLIPMNLGSFLGYNNLISDLFFLNEEIVKDKFIYCNYIDYFGRVKQEEYIKIAKLLKNQLLKIKKGWIDIIPFNNNLIFLKAEDGTYDFVFKNIRNEKFSSPYSNYLKHEYIPSILNEEYDFKRFLYFGFKEEVKNLKTFEPQPIWEENAIDMSESDFYKSNSIKNYPGRLNVLKNYYLKNALYSYSKKVTKNIIKGFNKVDLIDKTIYVSNLITIKDFFEFYNSEYKKNRSEQLDEIFTINCENDSFPVAVTWYDAVAYCRFLEKKHKVPFRLLNPEEFKEICVFSENKLTFVNQNISCPMDFFIGNEKLSSPPPSMKNFDDVIMKFTGELNFFSKGNIEFCTHSSFREWSNSFIDGNAIVFSINNIKVDYNHDNAFDCYYAANLNYKYKYLKIGFRVCYEIEKDA